MIRLTSEQIGDLGELLAAVNLSRPVRGRYNRPLFRPIHLGAKYPTADFIVDVLAADAHPSGFFFVQVRSTDQSSSAGRLPVKVDRVRFNRLARLPAPGYLVGVDLKAESCHLVAANKTVAADLPSIVGMRQGHSREFSVAGAVAFDAG